MNFSLLDWLSNFRQGKRCEKYMQDGGYDEQADFNKDGKLDNSDRAAITRRGNEIADSELVFDITEDGKVNYDDFLNFSEEMDVYKDGIVCDTEKAFLKGKTPLVYAKVKSNLENNVVCIPLIIFLIKILKPSQLEQLLNY